MKTRSISAARQLLDHVWSNANCKTSFSWERLNHSMQQALALAIGSGMGFEKSDWDLAGFNSGRWVGETMERYYRMAVIVGNRSAIETYEAWRNRKPIIANNVDMRARDWCDGTGYTHGNARTRKRERLAINCAFPWRGETIVVTSFTKEGAAVCCSYKPQEEPHQQREKILHRYVVTAELVQTDRAERKRARTPSGV